MSQEQDTYTMVTREAQLIGRPVVLVNQQDTVFNGHEGDEHTVSLLVFRTDPITAGGMTFHESRFSVWVDGHYVTGGVVA